MPVNKQHRRGESLIEVIIAIFVLAIAAVGALGLLMASKEKNDTIINHTIALNLAREGVEGVRSIRDSNWQYWAHRAKEDWDCLNSFDTPTGSYGCTGARIQNGSYIIYYDNNFIWRMEPKSVSLVDSADKNLLEASAPFCANVGTAGNHCQFSLRKFTCQDGKESTNEQVEENLYKDYGLYNHFNAKFDPKKVLSCPSGSTIRPEGFGTDFYREVKISNKTSKDFDVQVWVKWIENGQVREVYLTSHLSNYLPLIKNRTLLQNQ